MGLQTFKYLTMEKYRAAQMFRFDGTVYGMSSLVVSAGRIHRTSFMLSSSS